MRWSEPGHRAPVAIHAAGGRVAELGSLGTMQPTYRNLSHEYR